jgi:hypothetical protein
MASGHQLADLIPEEAGPDRDLAILDLVGQGHALLSWQPIHVVRGNVVATFYVTADAVRLGEPGDAIRFTVGSRGQQMLADELEAVLPTAQLADEIYRQAHIQIMPVTMTQETTTGMSSRAWMLGHSDAVDAQIVGPAQHLGFDPNTAIVAPVGKDWVVSTMLEGHPNYRICPTPKGERPQRGLLPAAINYGWHHPMAPGHRRSATLPNVAVYQPEADCHDENHHDYSQTARLVYRWVTVCRAKSLTGFGAITPCVPLAPCTLPDGTEGTVECWDIYDLAMDSVLHVLVNATGPVYMRHWHVPWGPSSKCDVATLAALGPDAATSCPKPPPPEPEFNKVPKPNQPPPPPEELPPGPPAAHDEDIGLVGIAAVAAGVTAGYYGLRYLLRAS